MKKYWFFVTVLAIMFLLKTEAFCQSNFILAGETSGSNTAYTDLIPDIRIINYYNCSSNWFFDIDKDDNYDFKFKSSSAQSPGGVYKKDYTIVTSGSKFIAIHPSSSQCADVINANDTIGENLTWGTSAILWYYNFVPGGTPSELGYWHNVENKYLGLKKVAGNDTIYCWLQLYVTGNYIHFREFATSHQLTKTNGCNAKIIDGAELTPAKDSKFQ